MHTIFGYTSPLRLNQVECCERRKPTACAAAGHYCESNVATPSCSKHTAATVTRLPTNPDIRRGVPEDRGSLRLRICPSESRSADHDERKGPIDALHRGWQSGRMRPFPNSTANAIASKLLTAYRSEPQLPPVG